jgi:hypothetical protein
MYVGEPEIQHLHLAVGGQHDVRRLQIAMDDPFLVRRLDGVDDLAGDAQRLANP